MQAVTVNMTGNMLRIDGTPWAGLLLFLGVRVDVQRPPLVAPVVDPDNPPPTPIPLFSTDAGDAEPFPAGIFGDTPDEVWRRTTCDSTGRFDCTIPTPEAAGWCAGARTDADIDPERGGLYVVKYLAVRSFTRCVTFAYERDKVANGDLDITDALSAAGL